jgi:hypothetical protein
VQLSSHSYSFYARNHEFLFLSFKLKKINSMSKITIKFFISVNDGRVASRPQYHGLSSAVTTIFRTEGVKGLYRGVTPNVWGSGSAWGFYFLL